MFRNTFFAAALSLATLTGAASAADLSGPYVVGSGENQEIVYPNGTQAGLAGGGLLSSQQNLIGPQITDRVGSERVVGSALG